MPIPRTDTHIHVTRYRETPKEEVTVPAVLARCVEVGLDRVGLVEHLSLGERHKFAFLLELAAAFRAADQPLPAALGTEVNMIDETGALEGSYAQRQEAGLDYVLAGIHYVPPEIASLQECFERNHRVMLAAMARNPWIDVVAHPWRPAMRQQLRPDGEPWSLALAPEPMIRDFVVALAQHGTACEVHATDARAFPDPAFDRFVDMLLEAKVRLAVASDAHNLEGIGGADPIFDYFEAQGVAAEQIWFPDL